MTDLPMTDLPMTDWLTDYEEDHLVAQLFYRPDCWLFFTFAYLADDPTIEPKVCPKVFLWPKHRKMSNESASVKSYYAIVINDAKTTEKVASMQYQGQERGTRGKNAGKLLVINRITFSSAVAYFPGREFPS